MFKTRILYLASFFASSPLRYLFNKY